MKLSYINSYKFARLADFTFSEVVTKKQFEELNIFNYEILYENDSHICYQKKDINLKDNYVVFCINDSIEILFSHIKKLNLSNLTLITNQTDEKISKYKFNKMPNQFSKWISVNVDFYHESLVAIPLGLSNGYAKNLVFKNDEFLINQEEYLHSKENLIYLNFEKNTNIRERNDLNNYFEKYDWAKVVTNKIGLEEYKNNLVSSSFVLCPEGNGIDTHRVWEALYSGSIPVIKNRIAFKSFDKLPILFVDSFYDVTAQTLRNYLNNLKSYDFKKIDFNYWSDYLKSDLNKSEEAITVQVNTTLNTLFQYRKSLYKRYLKLKNGFFRIIYRFKNKYQIHFKKIN